ncbi:hypothetical protein [Pseudomonas arcuscaelestis]|uniref:hypothetical protein n=1 Tax=Pseudomonas arcuscaelestis TaxID=2710591 RepID=UPI001F2DBC7B|nr:hypothetical protein [Pseudomonas arcuscaelestis]
MKNKISKFHSNLRLSAGFALFVKFRGDIPAQKAIVPMMFWSVKAADYVLRSTNLIRKLLNPILHRTPLGLAFLFARFVMDLAIAACHAEMKHIENRPGNRASVRSGQ